MKERERAGVVTGRTCIIVVDLTWGINSRLLSEGTWCHIEIVHSLKRFSQILLGGLLSHLEVPLLHEHVGAWRHLWASWALRSNRPLSSYCSTFCDLNESRALCVRVWLRFLKPQLTMWLNLLLHFIWVISDCDLIAAQIAFLESQWRFLRRYTIEVRNYQSYSVVSKARKRATITHCWIHVFISPFVCLYHESLMLF